MLSAFLYHKKTSNKSHITLMKNHVIFLKAIEKYLIMLLNDLNHQV